jgi:hydrogenase expression/formation protein HypE
MKKTILIGHGSGGIMTGNLIRDIFLKHFSNPALETLSDSAMAGINNDTIAFTTDSFVVDPIFFSGGDIGKLAVCGTVNDLAVSGARPLYLSCGFIIEEGLSMDDLEKIVGSMAAEAKNAGVQIITGDTKVVKKGQCDKLFINTAGIGIIDEENPYTGNGKLIKPGDDIIVNGFLGDHEIAILAAREKLYFEEPVMSDVASLNNLIESVKQSGVRIHFMRDITRGGIATVLSEVATAVNCGIVIEEEKIPVRAQVSGACEIYGFNPLYLANEGKVMMVVDKDSSDHTLRILHEHELGKDARVIGSVVEANPGRVIMKSVIGSTRIIDKLAGEQLPRIC